MKKILFTVTNDLTYDQRMIRICTCLAINGYEVVLIGRKLNHSKGITDQPFQQKRLSCFFNKGKLFYLEYNFRLFWHLLFSRFDVVCSIDLDTLLPGFLVSRIRKKKLVYDAHEYFTEVPEVVDRPKVKKIWTALEKWIVPKLKHAYTVCESIAELFEEKYKVPFGVIRNVPFKSILDQEIKKASPPVIIYQGALNEGRGLEQVIEAMQCIDDAQLWLVGEGDRSKDLRRLTQDLKLHSCVHFKGYLSPEELKKITPQATIGLNLLQNKGLSYYYSLANKAFDYIQADLPAIHMDFPEYQKLNATFETSVLIESLEPKLIADSIQKLLSNQLFYDQLKAGCQAAKKVYVWEKEAKRLLAFYEKVF